MHDIIKVSVIVPIYNVDAFLHQCINSILIQSLKEIEIILIEDGSSDYSLHICEYYKQSEYDSSNNYRYRSDNASSFNEEDIVANNSNSGINNSEDLIENKHFQAFKNYFYYLCILFSLNVIFYVVFTINTNNSQTNLIRYSLIPYNLRNLGYINNSKTIILNIANFELLLIIGKVLSLIYLPYGISLIISDSIVSFKAPMKIKKEYKNLNADINKNYDTIKILTAEKLMVGIPLTKKEKAILKEAKSKIDILEHKQEFLDEKVSCVETLKMYLSFPVKFVGLFLIIIALVFFIFSKFVVYYNFLKNSICGMECGYLLPTMKSGISLQDLIIGTTLNSNYNYNEIIEIFIKSNNNNIFTSNSLLQRVYIFFKGPEKWIFLIIIIFLVLMLVAIVKSVKSIGLLVIVPFRLDFYKEEHIRNDYLLNFMLYCLYGLMSIICLNEVLNTFPDFLNFGLPANKCNLSITGIEEGVCELSQTGLFLIKLKMNFSMLTSFYIIFELMFLITASICLIYFPIKSIVNFYNLNAENENFKEKRIGNDEYEKFEEELEEKRGKDEFHEEEKLIIKYN